jgi:23S rRNA (adenine1618-N6)-methyltransferase
LKRISPALQRFCITTKTGAESINFSEPEAVKLLNQALLHHYYGFKNWNFPDENLCPPIPETADYIHYIADLLSGI